MLFNIGHIHTVPLFHVSLYKFVIFCEQSFLYLFLICHPHIVSLANYFVLSDIYLFILFIYLFILLVLFYYLFIYLYYLFIYLYYLFIYLYIYCFMSIFIQVKIRFYECAISNIVTNTVFNTFPIV